MRPVTEADFWPQVVAGHGGCWIWTGVRGPDKPGANHGRFTYRGKSTGAHRVSWILAGRPDPTGKCVLHHCDNPPCVNPDHLYLGTRADNVADRVSRGRTVNRRGEEHGRSKLSDHQVLEIRERLVAGEIARTIAADYPVTRSTVSRIKVGDVWGHVK